MPMIHQLSSASSPPGSFTPPNFCSRPSTDTVAYRLMPDVHAEPRARDNVDNHSIVYWAGDLPVAKRLFHARLLFGILLEAEFLEAILQCTKSQAEEFGGSCDVVIGPIHCLHNKAAFQ